MLLARHSGAAMALDSPVVNFSAHGALRNSRSVELGMVVALTVAVVVVAALWGTSSNSSELVSVGALDSPEAVPAAEVSTGVQQSGNAPTAAQAETESNVAESRTPQIAAVSAAAQYDSGASMTPAQTGIVPGRPDPIEPALPQSFEQYQVQRGESLFAIAAARGVAVSELVQWNWHLQEDSTLIRGEWIWIPQWSMHSVADESAELADDGKSGRGGG